VAEMDQGLKRAVTMRPRDWLDFALTNGAVVYLGTAPTDVATEQGAYGLLPLVPFSKGGETLEATERAARLALTSAPTEQAESLAVLVGVFAARKLGSDIVQTMLRRLLMSSNTLELSPLYLKWVEEGREKGLRNAARLLLQGRFGSVSPEMEQAIANAGHAQLDDFMLHATTETLDELRARLSA